MLVAQEAVEIRVLSRQGRSIRNIARMLKVSRNTMRRYIRRRKCRSPPDRLLSCKTNLGPS